MTTINKYYIINNNNQFKKYSNKNGIHKQNMFYKFEDFFNA